MAEPIDPLEELDEHRRVRLGKLNELESRGIDPYPPRVDRTHNAAAALALFDPAAETQAEVAVAGRIVTQMKRFGKLVFCHIADGSGRIQLACRFDVLGAAGFALLDSLEMGDFVSARGHIFRTRTGEISVDVARLTPISKALRPLPEKFHGLTDVEKRYRQRYLDLIVNQPVRDVFVTRSRIIAAIRHFLDDRGFLEVETPILQPLYGGAAARPFETFHNALDRRLYLRIATELYLKRLLVGGLDRVYEIGHNFRNEGISAKHNPEFTVLESYQAYADYQDVMAMVEEMVAHVATTVLGTLTVPFRGAEISLRAPWRRWPILEAIAEYSGIDVEGHPTAELLAGAARRSGVPIPPDWNRGKIIDELLSTFVEPRLTQPTFLTDYPVEFPGSTLAKRARGSDTSVERFEGFVGGFEICNAFSELNDPRDQRARFEEQAELGRGGDDEAHPVDEDFLTALEHGMPPAGGLGVGIDRLVMLLTDQHSIRDVILFPQMRDVEAAP